ncbi:MAG TPA: c-type cytochrome [Thermoanaerobaculia bacterium]|nr:c-type cytochrome [Thermoanaerobaculia bacterium]
MKKTTITILMLITIALLPVASFAAEDGAVLYNGKCANCHGADGKKLGKADLTIQPVQAKSDADLITFVSTNAKHNFTRKGLTPDQIKAVVTFVRTLAKK